MSNKFWILAVVLLCGNFSAATVQAAEPPAACADPANEAQCTSNAGTKDADNKGGEELPSDPAAYECLLDRNAHRVA